MASLIVTAVFNGYNNLWQLPLMAAIAGIMTALLLSRVTAPLKTINSEIENLQNLNFNNSLEVSSSDEFEKI